MVRVVIGKVVGDDGKSLDFIFDNPGYRFGVRKEGTNDDYIYSPSLKGDQGIQGEKGDKGDNVDAYIEGTTLYVAVGQDILDHNYSSVDLKGEQGIQGLQGIQGIQGNPGMTGIFKGRVNTVSDLPTSPSEGDVYFLLNGDVYQYYNSAWSNVGNLKGDKGDKGDTGETGSRSQIKGTVNDVSSLPSTGNLEGDCYLIKDIGDLYSYLNSEWIKVGNLKGPIGTTLISILPFDSLESITNPEQGILYIIPHAGGTNPNVYDEYFYIESLAQFEQIGQQEMDLSGYCLKTDYYTKTEIDNLIGTANDIITG